MAMKVLSGVHFWVYFLKLARADAAEGGGENARGGNKKRDVFHALPNP